VANRPPAAVDKSPGATVDLAALPADSSRLIETREKGRKEGACRARAARIWRCRGGSRLRFAPILAPCLLRGPRDNPSATSHWFIDVLLTGSDKAPGLEERGGAIADRASTGQSTSSGCAHLASSPLRLAVLVKINRARLKWRELGPA